VAFRFRCVGALGAAAAVTWIVGCTNTGNLESIGTGANGGGAGASGSSSHAGSGTGGGAGTSTGGGGAGASSGAGESGSGAGIGGVDASTVGDGSPASGADAAVAGGGSDSSAVDPGTAGDGDRTINAPFQVAPEFTRGAGVPQGVVFRFSIPSSTIYPKAPSRNVAVYVPSQYKTGTPAPVMVFQDGTNFYGYDTAVPPVLDNLIAKGSIPAMVAVFASNGGGDAVGSERGLEYDTVSGLYAEWADKELLPQVEMQSKMLPGQAVTFTHDPEGRGAVGGSSGGAGSFSMVWWHPDLFRRLITFSGTYVNQVPANSPFPHGCWIYHDVDPYAAAPNGLIVQHCESATNPAAGSSNPGPCDTPLSQAACEAVAGCAWNTKVNKPIRVWHESGSNDLGAGGAPGTYRNFDLANQRMAASFKLRGYHYHYDHAIGARHTDGGVLRQTLPEALTWVWRGYQAPK
jgi:hypothetical protein